MIDEPILKASEWSLVRFQNATGIPRWRLVEWLWKIWAVFIMVRGLSRQRWGWIEMTLGGFLLTIYVAGDVLGVETEGKRDQDIADRRQMIVLNKQRVSSVSLTARLFFLTTLPVFILTSWLETLGGVLLITLLYLSALNTFPIQPGQTIRQRFKQWIAARRAMPQMENA